MRGDWGHGSRILGLLLSIVLGGAGALRGSEAGSGTKEIERRFAEANGVWESGDAAGALSAYRAIADEGWRSPDLFANIAGAAGAAGEHAMSALGAYQALLLRPADAEARETLRLALRALNEERRYSRLVQSAQRARLRGWLLWGGAAGFWLSMVLGVLLWAGGRVRRPCMLAGVSAAVFLALAIVGWRMHGQPPRPGTAWVTKGEPVELKTGPFDEAAVAGRLRPAELVEIFGADGEWLFVRAGAASEGWIPAASVERVMPWVKFAIHH